MRILGRLIQHPLTFSNPSCFSSPQLRDVDINRVSGDELEAAKTRRVDRDVDEGDVIAAEDVSIRGRDTITMPTEPSTSSREVKGAGLKIEQSANAARGQPVSDNHTESQQNYPKRRRRSTEQPVSGRWLSTLPLPSSYERLHDAFIALQQVGPLLRKRQQSCTADVVCSSVETMTGRRCTVEMLRQVEAIKPGTITFSVRGGGSDVFDSTNGPMSPRRVRADISAPETLKLETAGAAHPPTYPGSPCTHPTHRERKHKPNDAKAESASRFREALVLLVGGYHDLFCESRLREKVCEKPDDAPVMENGVIMEWHLQFDLEQVPSPPLERSTVETIRSDASTCIYGKNTLNMHTQPTKRVGNGSAMPSSWHAGHKKDAADVKANLLKHVTIEQAQAKAVVAELGDLGSELPLAAVQAVMKRKLAVAHELDPTTIATRDQRRLLDLLPTTFDTIRSLFATSKRKVSSFSELLEKSIRASSRYNVSPKEMEQALRLVAEASPEWCALMPASTTVSGEELFRVKTTDAAVTRFVRQKLVAMKEDKL